jgi:hypothetical protein
MGDYDFGHAAILVTKVLIVTIIIIIFIPLITSVSIFGTTSLEFSLAILKRIIRNAPRSIYEIGSATIAAAEKCEWFDVLAFVALVVWLPIGFVATTKNYDYVKPKKKKYKDEYGDIYEEKEHGDESLLGWLC